MVKVNKKAATELAVNSLVVIILSVVLLGLGLSFLRGTFSKTSLTFEEQVIKEPEPPAADASTPITLSREAIKTRAEDTESIKVDVYNPTNKDWTFRDAVSLETALCGINGDGVCYINPTGGQSDCNDLSTTQDDDCAKYTSGEYTCNQDSALGEGIGCVIIVDDPDCGVGSYDIGLDPDCGPTEPVKLSIDCPDLIEKNVVNPKKIKSGESSQFTALLKIKKKQEGTYLCKVGIQGFVGELEKYTKDLTIEIS